MFTVVNNKDKSFLAAYNQLSDAQRYILGSQRPISSKTIERGISYETEQGSFSILFMCA